MRLARIWVALAGIVLPYVARLPRGIGWLRQYIDAGLTGFVFLGAFNAIAWGAILAISLGYRRPSSLLAPVLCGFGFLAWAHATLDLAADAQAAVALVFIPVYALLPIAIGGVVGYVIDRKRRSR